MAAKHYANIGERKKVYHLKVKIKNAFKEAGSSGEFKTISTTQSVSRKKIQSLLYLRQSDYAGDNVEKLNEDINYPLFYKGFTYM